MAAKGHLLICQTLLPPAGEWQPPTEPWAMFRIAQGSAYWIGADSRLELAAGDAFLISDHCRGLVRASRLGEVHLDFFTINPDLLGGFLTLTERHLLGSPEVKNKNTPQLLPAAHLLARQFTQICEQAESSHGLFQRCQLLHLFATALQARLVQIPCGLGGGQCDKRFKELVASLSEQELMRFTPKELALHCGCSVRHFTRLFHDQFGCSVREKLTELRLRKARELLLLGQCTVAGVALATGFRHVGLFNVVFKRHFGLTPRHWRDQHRARETGR